MDYTITYDVGPGDVPQSRRAVRQRQPAQVTARFEEHGLFAVAPTTILGLSTRYSLGERGAINLIGLYQREQSAFNRPPLGFEASANLIGGRQHRAALQARLGSPASQRAGTSKPATAPSLFDVNAEFAFTKPDPNRSGQAYLEEFEGDAGLAGLACARRSGSSAAGRSRRPASRTSASAAASIRRTRWRSPGRTWSRAANGQALRAPPAGHRHADPGRRARRAAARPIMYLTLHADTAGGIVQRTTPRAGRCRGATSGRAGARWSPR